MTLFRRQGSTYQKGKRIKIYAFDVLRTLLNTFFASSMSARLTSQNILKLVKTAIKIMIILSYRIQSGLRKIWKYDSIKNTTLRVTILAQQLYRIIFQSIVCVNSRTDRALMYHMGIHESQTASAEPWGHQWNQSIKRRFKTTLKMSVTPRIFARSRIRPTPARIWKLSCMRKLKNRNGAEYFSISHEFSYPAQKNMILNGIPKKRKKTLSHIAIIVRYFANAAHIFRIPSVSPLPVSSEMTGKRNAIIGERNTNGIPMSARYQE